MHTWNSDPWLVTHNQVITSMSPQVLVLNFDNGQSSSDDSGLRKTGRRRARGWVDVPRLLEFVGTDVSRLRYHQGIDLTDSSDGGNCQRQHPGDLHRGVRSHTPLQRPAVSPLLWLQRFQRRLSGLCELFEKGLVNEVWIQDGGTRVHAARAALCREKADIRSERRRRSPVASQCTAASAAVRPSCLNVPCNVTVRMAHLDPVTGGRPRL